MKAISISLPALMLAIVFFSCSGSNSQNVQDNLKDTASSKAQITAMLDSFNSAAARADFDKYFDYYAANATFIGTDATEYWDKQAFMAWAKPHFDKKKTWDFKALKRHIYFGSTGDMAWFDELLNTQMKICRGSGVVVKQGNEWKVAQYVLSMTIPNSQSDSIIKIKGMEEDVLIRELGGR